MIRRLILATLPSGMFGNGGQTWRTLDVSVIASGIARIGVQVEIVSIDELFDMPLESDDAVVYTSSDEPNVRAYLRDVMYFVSQRCRIIPGYEFLLAHENKGFQELHKAAAAVGNLRGFYHYDLDAYSGPLPAVYKRIHGAASSGVRLLRNGGDIESVRKRDFRTSLMRRLTVLQRKLKLDRESFRYYKYRHKGFNTYVCQEFVPALTHDYKVLVFGDRYFSLKRYVRDNDFRASGSGKFDFHAETPRRVLEFAADLYDRFDVPFVSLDIAFSDPECHLIEYQALNFGPITMKDSVRHFVRTTEGWQVKEGKVDINECYTHAIAEYLARRVMG